MGIDMKAVEEKAQLRALFAATFSQCVRISWHEKGAKGGSPFAIRTQQACVDAGELEAYDGPELWGATRFVRITPKGLDRLRAHLGQCSTGAKI